MLSVSVSISGFYKIAYDVLVSLTKVSRFAMILMFLSEQDKQCEEREGKIEGKVKREREREGLHLVLLCSHSFHSQLCVAEPVLYDSFTSCMIICRFKENILES